VPFNIHRDDSCESGYPRSSPVLCPSKKGLGAIVAPKEEWATAGSPTLTDDFTLYLTMNSHSFGRSGSSVGVHAQETCPCQWPTGSGLFLTAAGPLLSSNQF